MLFHQVWARGLREDDAMLHKQKTKYYECWTHWCCTMDSSYLHSGHLVRYPSTSWTISTCKYDSFKKNEATTLARIWPILREFVRRKMGPPTKTSPNPRVTGFCKDLDCSNCSFWGWSTHLPLTLLAYRKNTHVFSTEDLYCPDAFGVRVLDSSTKAWLVYSNLVAW